MSSNNTQTKENQRPRSGGQLAGQIMEAGDCWTSEEDAMMTLEEDQLLFESGMAPIRVAEEPGSTDS